MRSRWAALLFLAMNVGRPQAPDPAAASLYKDQIQPLLKKSCLVCHSGKILQGGLDLSARESLLRGGENGAVVVPGNPDASYLYKLVSHQKEPGMPFKGAKLPEESISLI